MNLRSRWQVALIVLLLILLPLLAALQYSWIGQVSSAEHDRLANSLRVSTTRFADDFTAEIVGVFAALQFQGPGPMVARGFQNRYREAESSLIYPELVQNLYLIDFSADAPALLRLDSVNDTMNGVDWPSAWEPLKLLGRQPSNLQSVKTLGFASPARPIGPPPPGMPQEGVPQGPQAFGPSNNWWFLELNRNVLVNDLMPLLAERHFGEHDRSVYRIAVASGRQEPEVVYSSDDAWTREDLSTPDASIQLSPFAQPGGPRGGPPLPRRLPPGPFGERGLPRQSGPPRPGTGPVARLIVVPVGEPLRLLVKHRLGGLETAVDQVRTRNLVVSFGILVVLGAGITTLVVSSMRARALGKLQMDFAAGVSHELRTPLAVIQSAAYNLQSGAVTDTKAIAEYAVILQDESRRLSEMVNQVLLFAETQSGPKKYQVSPVDVAAIIDRSIRHVSAGRHDADYEIVMDIQSDLPPALADPAALTQCIQNLMSNALKYGKSEGTVQIKILASQDRDRREIQITVADRGPGISPIDRPRLFEPFYRGSDVSSNVPGNGLGLHLVKRLIESQGGRVTFNNNPSGKGACFTLHLRVAELDK